MTMHTLQKRILDLNLIRPVRTMSYRFIGKVIGHGIKQVLAEQVKHHIKELIKKGYLTDKDIPSIEYCKHCHQEIPQI